MGGCVGPSRRRRVTDRTAGYLEEFERALVRLVELSDDLVERGGLGLLSPREALELLREYDELTTAASVYFAAAFTADGVEIPTGIRARLVQRLDELREPGEG